MPRVQPCLTLVRDLIAVSILTPDLRSASKLECLGLLLFLKLLFRNRLAAFFVNIPYQGILVILFVLRCTSKDAETFMHESVEIGSRETNSLIYHSPGVIRCEHADTYRLAFSARRGCCMSPRSTYLPDGIDRDHHHGAARH